MTCVKVKPTLLRFGIYVLGIFMPKSNCPVIASWLQNRFRQSVSYWEIIPYHTLPRSIIH